MKIKLLPVLVSFTMLLPTLGQSAGEPIKSKSGSEVIADAKQAQEQAKTSNSQTTLHDLKTSPPPATFVQPAMPTDRMGSWRFGLWRNRSSGNYYHKGIDFSGHGGSQGDNVFFTDNGVITDKGSEYRRLAFKRGNGDIIMMLHAATRTDKKVGSQVKAGEYALKMGRTDKSGGNSYAKHLHYEYHVPTKSGRGRFVGVGGSIAFTSRGRGVTVHTDTPLVKGSYTASGYVAVNPAPYLKNDVIFNATDYDARLEDYIGNSARTQYNALYQPTPELPIGKGAKRPTKKFANLPVFANNMSPEEIAAMSTGAVDVSMFAGGAGYNVDGQLLSNAMMASFISANDGADWATLPQPPATNLAEMTPQEVVSKIAFQRFGNEEWESGLVKLSSKGLLTEYLLMNAEENFMRQQNQRLRNRVELQLASLNQAQLFEYNKKIESMNIMARADAVPKIIDRELEQLPNGYYVNSGSSTASDIDISNLPNDFNGLIDALLDAIAHGEGPSYDAFNNGTGCGLSIANGKGTGWYKPTQHTPVEILRQYNTSYKAGMQLKNAAQPKAYAVPCSKRIFASGFVQTTPATFSMAIIKYPEYANKPYTPQNQRELAKKALLLNTWRGPLKRFLNHGGDDKALNSAMEHMAWEWASISWGGGTAYNDGYNKANNKSTAMVLAVMKKIQQYHQNGGSSAQTPSQPTSDN